MGPLRRIILSLALMAGLVPAISFAQAPAPVPALPDTDRVTSYSLNTSTCVCSVGFSLYGDSTDFQSWLTVWLNGVQVAFNDPTNGWTITSPTGPLANIPRPITDGVLTFTNAQTATVQIVGARRPRRLSQFTEGRGVAARDLNQAVTDIIAQNRETWDLWERTLVFEPGFFPNALPLAAARANLFFCFGPTGQPTTCVATTGSTTFAAGNGITLSGTGPTTITNNISAGPGIQITGTNPLVIAKAPTAVNPQTGPYTPSSTDCGKTVLATGGFNTLTLPAASSVSSGCEIGIKNNEVYSGIGTARGKKLANFPSDWNPILWPGQAGKVVSDGTNWTTTQNPGRWHLPTNAELCYAQNGNDTNDGLASGTSCLAHVQTALNWITNQWDGTGNFSCAIGLYSGGTNTVNETVSQSGQSTGCFITVNMRAALMWTASAQCWTGGDGSIAIFNFNLGFTPILQCNTSNIALTGAFYGHQDVIYDINGSFEWIPGGSNDDLVVLDAQGRATLGLTTLVIGDGAARAANSILNCNYGCRGLQISGTVSWSPNVTINKIFTLKATSLINTTAAFSGSATVAGPSIVDGASVLTLNGTTPPGGSITPTHGGQSF